MSCSYRGLEFEEKRKRVSSFAGVSICRLRRRGGQLSVEPGFGEQGNAPASQEKIRHSLATAALVSYLSSRSLRTAGALSRSPCRSGARSSSECCLESWLEEESRRGVPERAAQLRHTGP